MGWGWTHSSRATLVAGILLAFSFLLITLRLTQPVRTLRLFVFYLISPSQEIAAQLIHSTEKFGTRIRNLVRLDQERAVLERKLQTLSLLESKVPALMEENQRLRELLDLKQTIAFEVIPAEVSARDIQNWYDSIRIARGTKDGIKIDQPVLAISEDPLPSVSLVGRVLECSPYSSKVLLISDPLSAVAAVVSRTGDQGLVTGQGLFTVLLDYVDSGSELQVGDTVVSSGLGTVFPAGLLIGKVEAITVSQSGFKRAKIKPAATLSKIREVLVLQAKGSSQKNNEN